ncbi:SAG1386/EF1546 family surface-associated protein [Enterococcus sp. LJL98]
MSRKKKQKDMQNNEANEPWEQPIYDTEGEETLSRSQKRHTKKSNTAFLTTVLILIFLIVAIPISVGAWGLYQKNKPSKPQPTPETTIQSTIESSSTVESTTESSTEASSTTTSSTQAVVDSSSEAVTPPVQAPEETPKQPDENQNQTEGAEYIEVLAGEGPNAVAARAGISVDELYRLNGMSADNFHLSPGQQLKIR